MFEILRDPYVAAMVGLSAERLDETAAKQWEKLDRERLFRLCAEHELDGVAAAHILEWDLFELPPCWRAAYDEWTKKQSFLKEKTAEICAEMQAQKIPMVILKNGGIMAELVADPAACPMEDIDSLVKKSDFLRAHEILLQNGFSFRFRSEYEAEELQSAFADGSTEYYLTMPNGEKMWFELAWRPIAGRWIRRDKEPDGDALVARAHKAGETAVGVLSPEDNLLQVCVHTAKHSYVRAPGLRLHLDVERIVSHTNIDWEVFLRAVEQTRVKTACYFSLYIPRKLFGTPVPQSVLDALYPGRRKAQKISSLLTKAGLLHPKARKFSKLSFLRFQTALYDSFGDLWRVLFPGLSAMREIYGFKSAALLPYYTVIRALDLVGIRKKYGKGNTP